MLGRLKQWASQRRDAKGHHRDPSADDDAAAASGGLPYAVCADGTVDFHSFQLSAYDPLLRLAAFVGDNQDALVVGACNARVAVPLRRGVHWLGCALLSGTTYLLVLSADALYCFNYGSYSIEGSSSALLSAGPGTQFTTLHLPQGMLVGAVGRRNGKLSFFKLAAVDSPGAPQGSSLRLAWSAYEVDLHAIQVPRDSGDQGGTGGDRAVVWITSLPSNPNALLLIVRGIPAVCRWYVSEDRLSRLYVTTCDKGSDTPWPLRACAAAPSSLHVIGVAWDYSKVFIWNSDKDKQPGNQVPPLWVVDCLPSCKSAWSEADSLADVHIEHFSLFTARCPSKDGEAGLLVSYGGGPFWIEMELDLESRAVVEVCNVYDQLRRGTTQPHVGVQEAEGARAASDPAYAVSPAALEEQLHGTHAAPVEAEPPMGSTEAEGLPHILSISPCCPRYWRSTWHRSELHQWIVVIAELGPFLVTREGPAAHQPIHLHPLTESTYYDPGLLPPHDDAVTPGMVYIPLSDVHIPLFRDPPAASRDGWGGNPESRRAAGWEGVLGGGTSVLRAQEDASFPLPHQCGIICSGERNVLRMAPNTNDACQAAQACQSSTHSPRSTGADAFIVEWLKGGFVGTRFASEHGRGVTAPARLVWREPLSYASDHGRWDAADGGASCRVIAEVFASEEELSLSVVDLAARQVRRAVIGTTRSSLQPDHDDRSRPPAAMADEPGAEPPPRDADAAAAPPERSAPGMEPCAVRAQLIRARMCDGVDANDAGTGSAEFRSTGSCLLAQLRDSSLVLIDLSRAFAVESPGQAVAPATRRGVLRLPRALFPTGSTVSSWVVAWTQIPVVVTAPPRPRDGAEGGAAAAGNQRPPARGLTASATQTAAATMIAVCGLADDRGLVVFDLCRSQLLAFHRRVPTPRFMFAVDGASLPRPPTFVEHRGVVGLHLPTSVPPESPSAGSVVFRDICGAVALVLHLQWAPLPPSPPEAECGATAAPPPDAARRRGEWSWKAEVPASDLLAPPRDLAIRPESWLPIPPPAATAPLHRLEVVVDQREGEVRFAWMSQAARDDGPDGTWQREALSSHRVAALQAALPVYAVVIAEGWPFAEMLYGPVESDGGTAAGAGWWVVPTEAETALWRHSAPPSLASSAVVVVHAHGLSRHRTVDLLVSTAEPTPLRDATASAPAHAPSFALPHGYTVEAAACEDGARLVVLGRSINGWRQLWLLSARTLRPLAAPFHTFRYTAAEAVSMTATRVGALVHVYLLGGATRPTPRLGGALRGGPTLTHVVWSPACTADADGELRWRCSSDGLKLRQPFAALAASQVPSPPCFDGYAGLLPTVPTGKEDKGFFKRLVATTVDEAARRVEEVLAKEREESFDDFAQRVIAPLEPRHPPAAPGKAPQTDRERLLGSGRYRDLKEKATRDGIGIDEARRAMNENLQLVHQRGERISRIQLKSEELATEAATFADLSRRLKEKQGRGWL